MHNMYVTLKKGKLFLLPLLLEKDKGTDIYGWVSKKTVARYTKISFPSALEAMTAFRVKVYFVNKEQFKTYQGLWGEEREKILNSTESIAYKEIKRVFLALHYLESCFVKFLKRLQPVHAFLTADRILLNRQAL